MPSFGLGKVHRKVIGANQNSPKCLYLTFDDGPDPECTPKVLDILARHNAQATFFVIGTKAQESPELVKAIDNAAHAIGNHSYDHRYGNYFASQKQMEKWILGTEEVISEICGKPSVGFRAPVGIRTPILHASLKNLDIPLVHWNLRFFDTTFSWSSKRAVQALSRTEDGSIVLLHDCHRGEKLKRFLETLEQFIQHGKTLGFSFRPLERRFFA